MTTMTSTGSFLEACPTLFEVDDDDDAVEDALGTIGIPSSPRGSESSARRRKGRTRKDDEQRQREEEEELHQSREEKNDTNYIDRGVDGSSSDAVARRQSDEKDEKSFSFGRCLDRGGVENVVLKTMSENNDNNNNNNQEEEEEEEDVEMGRSLRQENAEGEKNDGPSAAQKASGASTDR